jgi:hypothetical protein
VGAEGREGGSQVYVRQVQDSHHDAYHNV